MYFCQPAAASALSSVSAVSATETGEVNLVTAGLAYISLEPVTRGSLLVLSEPSSGSLSLLEQPAASRETQISANRERRTAPDRVLPRMKVSACIAVSEKAQPTAAKPFAGLAQSIPMSRVEDIWFKRYPNYN